MSIERRSVEEIQARIKELRETNPDEVKLAEELVDYEQCEEDLVTSFKGLTRGQCRVLAGADRVKSEMLGPEEKKVFEEAMSLLGQLNEPESPVPEKREVGDAA